MDQLTQRRQIVRCDALGKLAAHQHCIAGAQPFPQHHFQPPQRPVVCPEPLPHNPVLSLGCFQREVLPDAPGQRDGDTAHSSGVQQPQEQPCVLLPHQTDAGTVQPQSGQCSGCVGALAARFTVLPLSRQFPHRFHSLQIQGGVDGGKQGQGIDFSTGPGHVRSPPRLKKRPCQWQCLGRGDFEVAK